MSTCDGPSQKQTESGTDSCCGHGAAAQTPTPPGAQDEATCPVMPGSTVIKAEAEEAGLFRDYQGQRYWLCCDSCGPLFDAEPGLYVTS